MLIASRSLNYRSATGDVPVPVSIHAPEKSGDGWICRFAIGWPDGAAERWGAGSDAVQAIIIAMQMIGAEIYASAYHRSGGLGWLSPGRGYGFPVANNIRDVLVGEDARFF
jgi:hypothetical protein